MHIWEVGDVEKVVDHTRGRCVPHVDLGVDPPKRGVALLHDGGDRRPWFAYTDEHQPVLLRHPIRLKVGSWRRRHTTRRRRHVDTCTTITKCPTVIRTHQTSGLNGAFRQWCLAVRTLVGRCHHRAVGTPVQHHVAVQQLHALRLRTNIDTARHCVPCGGERVIAAQDVVHRSTA